MVLWIKALSGPFTTKSINQIFFCHIRNHTCVTYSEMLRLHSGLLCFLTINSVFYTTVSCDVIIALIYCITYRDSDPEIFSFPFVSCHSLRKRESVNTVENYLNSSLFSMLMKLVVETFFEIEIETQFANIKLHANVHSDYIYYVFRFFVVTGLGMFN